MIPQRDTWPRISPNPLENRARTIEALLHEWKTDLLRIWIPLIAGSAMFIGLFGSKETAGEREVKSEGGMLPPRYFTLKISSLRKVSCFAPYRPTATPRSQSKLMTGDIDRLHARKAEIPDHRRMKKGRDESAARRVHVDGNVKSGSYSRSSNAMETACTGSYRNV
jgi:hypothetical protein